MTSAVGRQPGYWRLMLDLQREELAKQRASDDRRYADPNITLDAHEDRWAWRRALRRHPVTHLVYRSVIGLVGAVLILVGIPMIPLTGPGWVVVFLGVAVWSSEFEWAQRLLHHGKARLKGWERWVLVLPWSWRLVGVGATLVLAWALMWGTLVMTGVAGWVPDPISTWLLWLPGVNPA
ncbi:TIGR02611 family protein [Kribbia dieselivorans]|uniref:TIGR02611 family protein n=1 Tax=Kribbia dieselivorans TaxID=331526 RepID=UPI00083881DE|nr:TIGR02611 family protein [Kribbia dieselivorans]